MYSTSLFGRAFPNDRIPVRSAELLDKDFMKRTGFSEALIVKDAAGIGLTLPPKTDLTVSKIVEILGANYQVPVIDVEKQV